MKVFRKYSIVRTDWGRDPARAAPSTPPAAPIMPLPSCGRRRIHKCIVYYPLFGPSITTPQQPWSSGRILACHAGDPGSIPGGCTFCFLKPQATRLGAAALGFRRAHCRAVGLPVEFTPRLDPPPRRSYLEAAREHISTLHGQDALDTVEVLAQQAREAEAAASMSAAAAASAAAASSSRYDQMTEK